VLRVWRDHETLVCEIRGRGVISDPLAGRIPPAADAEHGRGLLLVNHRCDLIQLHPDRTGTTVRLHMRVS
jgi:histidine kinase-like protein